MTSREQILQEALALPAEDRQFLAEQLDLSLTGGEFVSPEVAAAWNDEIERRLDAFDRGEIHARDADEAVAQMRRYLEQHRARNARS